MRVSTLVEYTIVLNVLERLVSEVFELAALGVVAILLVLVSVVVIDAMRVEVYPVLVCLGLRWL
jgi:hypothetical protein